MNDTIPEVLDDFSDLDALVSESMEQKLARKQKEVSDAKAKKEKKALSPDGKKVWEEGNARSMLYETRREWVAAAQVAFYDQQFCTHCQSYNSVFRGIFERQEDKTKSRIDRWVKPEDTVALARLPKESKVFEENVPQCACCAESQGW